MRIQKELMVMLYIFVFLLNDPQITRTCELQTGAGDFWLIQKMDADIPVYSREEGASEFHFIYALNGGVNDSENPDILYREELPFTLKVPVREGYNFAGWYADSSYTHKITKIDSENAADMILFAKWTKAIDNQYNVEMYSYQSANMVGNNQKELKECAYRFLDEIEIPGMPSTRESDYINNIICSESQCFQGLCFTPELVLMTAYAEESDAPGSLLVFDRESNRYLMTLGMKKKSHLGGIAYDGENVWICHSNNNTLERISYEFLLMVAEAAPECYLDASTLSEEYRLKNKPSCITCYGGRIWVATYDKFFHSEMISYCYSEEWNSLIALSSYSIPSKVQGVAFDDKGIVYLSTSLGRVKSSYLKVYDSLLALDKAPDHPSVKVEMPPCSEEIALEDGNLYVLFESASQKYLEGTDGNGTSASPIDKVLELDVASVW